MFQSVVFASISLSKLVNLHFTTFQSAPDQIIARAQSRFNMKIDPNNLEFVYLHRRKWVEAEMYPYFTLLGQSLGSVWLG